MADVARGAKVRPAHLDGVLGVEKAIDAAFEKSAVAGTSYEEATWYAVGTLEDVLRWLAQHDGVATDIGTQIAFMGLLNRWKFALKHILQRLSALPRRGALARPADIPRQPYETSFQLARRAETYHAATAAFSSFHSGASDALFDDEGSLLLRTRDGGRRLALDFFTKESSGDGSIPSKIVQIFFDARGFSDLQRELADGRERLGEFEVAYSFSIDRAGALERLLPIHPQIIPADWSALGLSGVQVSSVLRALEVRSAYHVLATVFSSDDVEGGSLARAAWLIPYVDLIQQLSAMTGLSESEVEAVLGFLEFGRDVQQPDPALQPIFRFGSDALIPAFLTASSNSQRNFLALLARAKPNEFDAASQVFEREMLAGMQKIVPIRYPRKQSFYIPGEAACGEVDLLLADPITKCLAVVEARWTMEPAEVREVQNRDREIAKKVRQASVKCAGVRKRMKESLALVGLDPDPNGWVAHPLVVMDGCSGRTVPPDVPIIPIGLFRFLVGRAHGLRELFRWVQSDRWLPLSPDDFKILHVPNEIDGIRFESDAFDTNLDGREFFSRLARRLHDA